MADLSKLEQKKAQVQAQIKAEKAKQREKERKEKAKREAAAGRAYLAAVSAGAIPDLVQNTVREHALERDRSLLPPPRPEHEPLDTGGQF